MTNTNAALVAEITQAVIAVLDGRTKAKAPVKARTRKAPVKKAAAKKAPAKKAQVRPLSKKSLQAFKTAAAKEGVDFAGQSTRQVAEFCVTEGYAPKGFRIGEGYTEMFS